VWEGFCGSLIRRTSRNILVMAILVLATAVFTASYNAKYLASFFVGAHAVALDALPTANPDKLTDTFVRMQVSAPIPTGIQHITTDDQHPNGTVDSSYVATVAGGKAVIIRTDQIISPLGSAESTSSSFEGRFRPMSADLQTKIQDALSHNANMPPILPVYLDTVDYRENGYMLLIFGLPLLALGLWLLWRYQRFSGDFTNHPFAKVLARYGQLEMLVQEIDSETAGAHSVYGSTGTGLIVTPRWLIACNPWGGTPIRFDHLTWCYRHVMKRKMFYVITISKQHSLLAYDSFGNKSQIRLKEQLITDALADLAIRAPQAIYGYDKKLWKLWKGLGKDKSRFTAEARALAVPGDALKDKTSTMWNA
jgi:hypothetical protein